jgi:two-component system, OmpR family, sensor histidine kinase SenX3
VIQIRVADHGPGIPLSEQERIFEKFYRADPHHTRTPSGTGLGLYISRELIRRMGGRIEVRSRPGTGSTFVVELPSA